MNLIDEDHFERIKMLVTISGLCHDLGHGPYSHMFDSILLPRLKETNWKHEEGSCMMLKALLEEPESKFNTNPIKYNNFTFSPQNDL